MQVSDLVLLGGAGGSAAEWAAVTALLGGRFRPLPVERGLGLGFEAEAARLAAVLDGMDGPVALLGHSGGAVVALEAAVRTAAADRLVLYEPPVLAGHEPYRLDGLAERMRRAIGAGRPDRAAAAFLRGAAGMSERQAAALRPALAGRATALLRGLEASHAYRFEPERFSRLDVPALLLVGSESLPHHRASIDALRRVLPRAEVVELAGQGHQALSAAPALVAGAIAPFLTGR